MSEKEPENLRERNEDDKQDDWGANRHFEGEKATTEDEKKTEELYKKVRAVLNKLTPQKFDTLVNQVRLLLLQIDNRDRLQGVVDLVFDKAIIDKPNVAFVYAMMCKEIQNMQVSIGHDKQRNLAFRTLLVTRCQYEFEQLSVDDSERNAKVKEIEATADVEKKNQLQFELDEYDRKLRMKSVGCIRFLGELFKQQMLAASIMRRCLQSLLNNGDEKSLECLCTLLTSIGKELEFKKNDLRSIFEEMKKISTGTAQKVSSRIRFMLQDVIDLRDSSWVPRRTNPKTIDQIQKKAENEQMNFHLMNSMNPPHKDIRGGGRQKGGSRAEANEDTWLLSPASNRGNRSLFSFQSDKMKADSKPPTDEMFGPGKSYSVYVTRAVGAKGPSTTTNNTYSALENAGDMERRPINKTSTSRWPPRPPSQQKSIDDKPNQIINISREILDDSLEKITDYVIDNLKELSKSDLTNEDIIFLLKIISNACDNDCVQRKSYMLKCVMELTFIIKIRAFLTSVATIENPSKEAVLYVLTILENSMQLIPNTCKEFVEMVVKTMLLILPVLKGDWSGELDRVKTIKQDLERLESLFNIPKLEASVEINDPALVQTSSRDISSFDLENFECKDFTTPERSFVRKNIIKGPYKSVNDYLDIHFRLLREDFLSPIREDLCDYLNNRNRHMFNIKVHKDVSFSKTKYEKNKELTVLQIKMSEKLLNMLESGQHKRFMCGSLLLFSNDGFKTLFTGKVMGTRGLLEGKLDVEVYGDVDVFGGTFTMVECTVFYEPYFQVLSVIQILETVPMERYIVNVETNVSHPKYMETFDSYSLPSNLNPSQRAAMHAALNKELVVIQGPPGTGKTFLGMELVKLLLSIKKNVELEGPILIVTYTNHALEQFLEGLEGYTNKIVRLGHGSQDLTTLGPEAKARRLMLPKLGNIVTGTAYDSDDDDYDDDQVYEHRRRTRRGHDSLEREVDIYIRYLSVRKKNPHRYKLEAAYRYLPSDLKEWLDERRTLTSLYRSLKENEVIKEKYDSKDLLYLGIFESYENIVILCWLMCNDGSILPVKFFALESLDADEDYIFELLFLFYFQLKAISISDEFNIGCFRAIHKSIKPSVLRQLQTKLDFLSSKANFLEQCLNTNFGHTTDNMENYNDIFEIPCRTRWQIYQRMINDKMKNSRPRHDLLVTQERQCIGWEHYLNLREMDNVKLLKKMDIVAMTTTRAAKMRSTLELIGSPIVLVEEAAEVLESHIISALTTDCQHLILLGDHQQLRPTTADYTMGQKYNLGISLFERLILNNIECHTLNVQHRMRPEISSLIHPLFYKELYNDRKVEEYPMVSGIKCPLYFIDHLESEESYGDSSKMNVHEAKFLIQLAIFLLNNNYNPDEITILAAYRGQMYEMKKQQSLCENEKLQNVSIAVVDNFQGEENKIILLSLVRNNTEGSVGFLSTDNRVCVALSRAKHGLYIMGNMDLLCSSSEIWKSIRSSLESQKAIGRYLPLRCKIHPEHETLVSKVADFEKVPNGGCNQRCNTNLECGHTCDMICHAFDRDHKIYNCKEKCKLLLCENPNHLCRKLCFEPCGPCNYSVERILTCGHKKTIACHKDVTKEKCLELKPINPVCGHDNMTLCHQDETTYKCDFLIQRELDCSHSNQVPCGQDVAEFQCQQEENVTFKCGHNYLKKCHVNVDEVHCKEVVEKELPCKHKVNIECGENVEKDRYHKCMEPCQKSMAGCTKPAEHGLCPLKCSDRCQPCPKIMSKTFPDCSHSLEVECHKSYHYSEECQKICRRKRPCGHICYKKCWEDCGLCEQSIKKTAECGHVIKKKCYEPKKCHKPCNKKLDCGHQCPNKCFEPCDNCTEKCGKVLNCGH